MANSDRLIAIGDVHGCIHALDAVLEAIAPRQRDTLVFLGDLIDNGRDSRSVLQRVSDLEQQCRVVLIEGNHEEMLLAARDNVEALRYWENCGGMNTLNSYRFCGTLADIPDSHWELLAGARPYWETDDFIFTHASYLADVPMALQPDYQLRWALLEPAELRPHVSGKPVIVGHTEQPDSEVLDLGYAICLDTACWRHGWLTALDVYSRDPWQASRWGMLREAGEAPHRGRLPQLAMAG